MVDCPRVDVCSGETTARPGPSFQARRRRHPRDTRRGMARRRPAGRARTCCHLSAWVLGDPSVGCLTTRAPIEAVRLACGEVRDTAVRVEGQLQPAVEVGMAGGRATAEIVSGRVGHMGVSDPAPQAADSIGGRHTRQPLGQPPWFPGGLRRRHLRADRLPLWQDFEIRGLPHRGAGGTVDQVLALPD